jgi:MFS family permease
MNDPAALSSSLLRHRSFVLFWCARTATGGAFMMQGVAVGWQIYDLTNNPLDLGLVGLVQFVPIVAMAVVIGQIADRYDRRFVAGISQVVKALAAAAFALGTWQGWLSREAMFAILFVSGTARAFEVPTMHAMVPGIVPAAILPRAIAASATAQQTAVICGPAIGGFLYLFGPATVYLTCTVAFVIAAAFLALTRSAPVEHERKPVTLATLFAGFGYIRRHPILLGTITLDLFAVLLGGVTALLPIFARDILDTGPWGLGLLRSAPALGALTISIVLAHYAIERSVGQVLFASVAAFGLAAILFALSSSLVLSIAALALYGAADAISVVIRHSLVLSRTPSDMLGRVTAVNSMFTGSSGSLGEFRAGMVAAWLGAVPSALIGGIGAIVVTVVWMRAFPDLTRIRSLTMER